MPFFTLCGYSAEGHQGNPHPLELGFLPLDCLSDLHLPSIAENHSAAQAFLKSQQSDRSRFSARKMSASECLMSMSRSGR